MLTVSFSNIMYTFTWLKKRNKRDENTYSVMGQLKGDLDEGIRAGAALLNQTLSKVMEGDDVAVHIICQTPG